MTIWGLRTPAGWEREGRRPVSGEWGQIRVLETGTRVALLLDGVIPRLVPGMAPVVPGESRGLRKGAAAVAHLRQAGFFSLALGARLAGPTSLSRFSDQFDDPRWFASPEKHVRLGEDTG